MARATILDPAGTRELIVTLRAQAGITEDRYDHLTEMADILNRIGSKAVEDREVFDKLLNHVNVERRILRLESALNSLESWMAQAPGRRYSLGLAKTATAWRASVRLYTRTRTKNFIRGGSKATSVEAALTLAATHAEPWSAREQPRRPRRDMRPIIKLLDDLDTALVENQKGIETELRDISAAYTLWGPPPE